MKINNYFLGVFDNHPINTYEIDHHILNSTCKIESYNITIDIAYTKTSMMHIYKDIAIDCPFCWVCNAYVDSKISTFGNYKKFL